MRRAALDPQAQYLADLEVIERCEQQIEREAGCPDFFGCMGVLQRLQREPETGAR